MTAIAVKNRDAYRTLAERYMDDLFFFAQRMLRDRAGAEDIVQTVFLRIWEHPRRWQPDKGRFKAWLWAISANLCRDTMRKSGRIIDGAASDFVLETTPDCAALPDDHAQTRSQLKYVITLITILPDRQRHALYFSVYDELTHKEIAKLMDISADAVESLIARARKNLRQMMSEEIKDKNVKQPVRAQKNQIKNQTIRMQHHARAC